MTAYTRAQRLEVLKDELRRLPDETEQEYAARITQVLDEQPKDTTGRVRPL
jgi:hypothetical protein